MHTSQAQTVQEGCFSWSSPQPARRSAGKYQRCNGHAGLALRRGEVSLGRGSDLELPTNGRQPELGSSRAVPEKPDVGDGEVGIAGLDSTGLVRQHLRSEHLEK